MRKHHISECARSQHRNYTLAGVGRPQMLAIQGNTGKTALGAVTHAPCARGQSVALWHCTVSVTQFTEWRCEQRGPLPCRTFRPAPLMRPGWSTCWILAAQAGRVGCRGDGHAKITRAKNICGFEAVSSGLVGTPSGAKPTQSQQT